MDPLLGAAFLVVAQVKDPAPQNLESLPQSSSISSETAPVPDSDLEPEVSIIDRGDKGKIEEYRMHGALYMVKVMPVKGPPYYLIDSDGDGNLETRQNNMDPDVVIPRWTLLRWK